MKLDLSSTALPPGELGDRVRTFVTAVGFWLLFPIVVVIWVLAEIAAHGASLIVRCRS